VNIAAITVTYNDDCRLDHWFEYYNEYREAISLHIIVDNGSHPRFVARLEQLFPSSTIITRHRNDGTTAAYNDGIRYALALKQIDSIMLLANDVRIHAASVAVIHEVLFADKQAGIVAPILFRKDSDVIDDYGSNITHALYMRPNHIGERVSHSLPIIEEAESVMGGVNLARREYYETIGLQDEALFMYSDEVDMALRMVKAGFRAFVTRRASAWHQHIAAPNSTCRPPLAEFLLTRNETYLAYKHFGFARALYIFFRHIYKFPFMTYGFLRRRMYTHPVYYVFGSVCGILRIQKNFRILIDSDRL
jgi:GT2 family glycosyltransferase